MDAPIIRTPPLHHSHLTYEHGTMRYSPREWYEPANSGHPGLGILFPHPRSHQHSNASLVRSSFRPSKPLETYSDASGRVFRPITDLLWPRNPLCHGTGPAPVPICIVYTARSRKRTPKYERKPRLRPQILNAPYVRSCASTLKREPNEWASRGRSRGEKV